MPGSSNSQPEEIIAISYTGCKKIEKETTNIWGSEKKNDLKEFSFNLKLLKYDFSKLSNEELYWFHSQIFHEIKNSIDLLKEKLREHSQQKVVIFFSSIILEIGRTERTITSGITNKFWGHKNNLIWNLLDEVGKHALNRKKYNAQNFGNITKQEQLKILDTFSAGITIKLRMNDKNINLDNFNQIGTLIENKHQSQIVLQAAQTEHVGGIEQNETEPTQQKTQNITDVIPFTESLGDIVAREVVRNGPVVLTATRDNIPKYTLFFPLSNFLDNLIRSLSLRKSTLLARKKMAITYYPEQQEAKQDKVIGEKNSDFQPPKKLNTPEEINNPNVEEKKGTSKNTTLTQARENRTEKEHTSTKRRFMQIVRKVLGITKKNHPIHTTAGPTLTQVEENHTNNTHTTEKPTLKQAEENHEENRGVTAEPALTEMVENHEEEHITVKPTFTQKIKKSLGIINDDDIQAQEIIKRANSYAETEMMCNESKANEKQKTLDEIFCETVIAYYDTRYPKFLMEIIESVFKTIFLKEISKKPEISEEDILNTLKIFGLEFNKGYLLQQIGRKRDMLYDSIKLCSVPNKPKNKIQSLYRSMKGNFTTYNAQKKARDAIKNNTDKTLDEIFIEVMKNYTNQNRETFICIFDKVFNIIFCGKKNPSKIETFEEIFNILKRLELQFDVEYLKDRVWDKKTQLSELVLDKINSQPTTEPKNTPHKSINPSSSNIEENQTPHPLPAAKAKKAKTPPATDTAFKSSLKTVFSSKEGYVCVFFIASSISILCLWYLPLGKVTILQGLVPKEKREFFGLILNILLLTLIALLVLNLIHYVYSEYKANNIGKKTQPVTNTPFKSSLNTVFSSKKGYLSVFAIASSISILCLWHLPLGEVPILQSLVPEETREFAGLILHILLLTLIVLLVLGLAYYIHSEYKAHNIGSLEEIDIENPIEKSKFKEQELYL